SVHHFFKYVAGKKIKRPPWFFDVEQEGDGIVDVTTHLVDLIQWACYPEVVLDYKKDIQMLSASRWATPLTKEEFGAVTRLDDFPDYLKKDIAENGVLNVYSNGEMTYKLKDIYARVRVEWRYRAPEGTGDTHYSIIRGSKADLEIRQGEKEHYKPELYILPHDKGDQYRDAAMGAFNGLADEYPGIALEPGDGEFHVVIPDKYRVGHEAHFGQVTKQFLAYLKAGKLPEWEVPNCIVKYYTTTAAFELAKKQD
ncbi:MAG: oxidoreductase, partial [Bacteroidales bacterium]|nr:oxidoreductase [Bacteroidales bacterium]